MGEYGLVDWTHILGIVLVRYRNYYENLIMFPQPPIDFYLDAFELLNKPRRIFQGLAMQIEAYHEYTEVEKDLALRMVKQMEKDFYQYTLPMFEDELQKLL